MKLKTALATATLGFSTAALAQGYANDPSAERTAALSGAARDSLGDLHVRNANNARVTLGLTADATFVLISVSPDDVGGSHARLQQYFRSIKVKGGEFISHVDARGTFTPFTDQAQRGIAISTIPAISVDRALAAVHCAQPPLSLLVDAPDGAAHRASPDLFP